MQRPARMHLAAAGLTLILAATWWSGGPPVLEIVRVVALVGVIGYLIAVLVMILGKSSVVDRSKPGPGDVELHDPDLDGPP